MPIDYAILISIIDAASYYFLSRFDADAAIIIAIATP